MKPVRFTPYLKSVIWGGEKIACLKNIETELTDIGESWEISGVAGNETRVAEGTDAGLTTTELIDKYQARLVGEHVWQKFGHSFPLLVKIIDARKDLSVQVHPDDRLAQERHGCAGKTEMWYILEAEPGAKIYAGLCRRLDSGSYRRAVEAKTIMDYIQANDSAAGDVFFLPAGRVHAIGAGNLLLEIQQTSDITYRIYDYDRRDADGNPRQLHTELAADAIDYKVYPDYKSQPEPMGNGLSRLAECRYFDVRLQTVNDDVDVDYAKGSFVIVSNAAGMLGVATDGSGVCQLSPGQTLLIPAEREFLRLSGSGTAVVTFVPRV